MPGLWRLFRWLNPLYWLLHWPPTRKQVLGFVVVGLLAAVVLLGPLFVGLDLSGNSAAVETVDVNVSLNDEFTPPEGSTGVVDCITFGTPWDTVRITGSVEVYAPDDDAAVVVSLAGFEESTVDPVEDAGFQETQVLWSLEDDETLTVGETATLQVRVRSGGETLAATNRTVPVEEGTLNYRDCE